MKPYRYLFSISMLALAALLVGIAMHTSTTFAQDSNAPTASEDIAVAQGTAFTYQGNLKQNGQPVNATCTFKLSLWDALTQGVEQGTPQTVSNVDVQAGTFSVQVNFGNQFTGAARWVQTSVQCAGENAYTALSPRQPLNAVPYAVGLRPGAIMQSAASGDAFSVEITAADSAAIHGTATGEKGTGVLGESTSWAGVWGESEGASGVVGISHGEFSGGVYGENKGAGIGVVGKSADNTGVYGESESWAGVWGQSAGASGVVGVSDGQYNGGVYGLNEGGGYGVYGKAPYSTGVFGESELWVGVYGMTTGIHEQGTTPQFGGVFGEAHGLAPGVLATSSDGSGVYAKGYTGIEAYGLWSGVVGTAEAYGVFGTATSSSGTGVVGVHSAETGSHPGVAARTNSKEEYASAISGHVASSIPGANSAAVKGLNSGTGASGIGVWGEQKGIGFGVYGLTPEGGYGVVGESPSPGYAGYFKGRVHVTGNLSKGGGSFKIDHPLDPANKYLSHSFVESPDMMNIYNGNVTTDAEGYATVTLPDYFEALNQDFRYQLTAIGQFAQAIVVEEIQGNQFRIQTDNPAVKVSWQVTGIRHDPFAEANRIQVEEKKSGDEQGRYLYPEVYGKDVRESVWYGVSPNAQAMIDNPEMTNFDQLLEVGK